MNSNSSATAAAARWLRSRRPCSRHAASPRRFTRLTPQRQRNSSNGPRGPHDALLGPHADCGGALHDVYAATSGTGVASGGGRTWDGAKQVEKFTFQSGGHLGPERSKSGADSQPRRGRGHAPSAPAAAAPPRQLCPAHGVWLRTTTRARMRRRRRGGGGRAAAGGPRPAWRGHPDRRGTRCCPAASARPPARLPPAWLQQAPARSHSAACPATAASCLPLLTPSPGLPPGPPTAPDSTPLLIAMTRVYTHLLDSSKPRETCHTTGRGGGALSSVTRRPASASARHSVRMEGAGTPPPPSTLSTVALSMITISSSGDPGLRV